MTIPLKWEQSIFSGFIQLQDGRRTRVDGETNLPNMRVLLQENEEVGEKQESWEYVQGHDDKDGLCI